MTVYIVQKRLGDCYPVIRGYQDYSKAERHVQACGFDAEGNALARIVEVEIQGGFPEEGKFIEIGVRYL